jgi:hypothetical protein
MHDSLANRDTSHVIHKDTIGSHHDIDQDLSDFRERTREEINRIDRKLDSLGTDYKNNKGKRRADYEEKRKQLIVKSQRLRSKLDSSRVESRERSQEFKREMDHDMNELGNAIKDLFRDNKK